MSSVYATEPATAGRVIFETSHGPLDIQLWCRECPATTKFFLQLCLDGFYDNMLFHRIVPSLLIQTGAMRANSTTAATATATTAATEKRMADYRTAVDADAALERRSHECNSRLRFNHRGQVAMALAVDDNDNDSNTKVDLQPQFFITTEDAPYLDGKHVIFGTLGAGPTIFNAIRIGNTEVDDVVTNQPTELEHAPRIKSVKIVENTVHQSITPRENIPWRIQSEPIKKKRKRKGTLDVNVLSFGDEMGEISTRTKTTTFSKKREKGSNEKRSRKHSKDNSVEVPKERDQLANNGNSLEESSSSPTKTDDAVPATVEPSSNSTTATNTSTAEGAMERADDVHEYSSRRSRAHAAAAAAEKTSNVEPTTTASLAAAKKPAKKAKISLVEARRQKYSTKGKTKQSEEETLAKLMAFKGKMHGAGSLLNAKESSSQDNSLASRMARRAQKQNESSSAINDNVETYHGQILESDGDDDSGWLQTKFKCRRHMDQLAGDRNDDYKVIDGKEERKERSSSHHKKEKKRRHGEHRKRKR